MVGVGQGLVGGAQVVVAVVGGLGWWGGVGWGGVDGVGGGAWEGGMV